MEHQLFKQILAVMNVVDKPRRNPCCKFSMEDIIRVWFWAVLNDRPVIWACDPKNWPLHERRRPLPSSSTMSRRLRRQDVQTLIRNIEQHLLRSQGNKPLAWMIDGKPLVIGNASKDRQAGFGRAVRGKAKGYKLHSLIGMDGSIAAWRVAPLNKDERIMARRMLRGADIQGYVLADGMYDSNPLHEICEAREELQLVATPRGGYHRPRRRRAQSNGRRRAIALLENPQSKFGRELLKERDAIERSFGNLSNWGGGLTHLPPWARTHRRVHRWVQAKLIINAIKHPVKNTTYVN